MGLRKHWHLSSSHHKSSQFTKIYEFKRRVFVTRPIKSDKRFTQFDKN